MKYKEELASKKEIKQVVPEAVKFKYRFQGQEYEDELGKNTYAYQWRDYDPAIARFNKIDRFSEKYFDLTPYHFGANNPIYFREIAGDSLTKNAQEFADRIVEYANNQIDELKSEISEKKKELKKQTKKRKIRKLNRKIKRLQNRMGKYQTAIDEIEDLKSSNQWYDVQPMDAESTGDGDIVTYGKTEYDTKTGMVVMYIGDDKLGYIAHEFLHAYQFEIGVLDFGSENHSLLFNNYIEYTADKRATLFGNSTNSSGGDMGAGTYYHSRSPSTMSKLYENVEGRGKNEKFIYRYHKKTYIWP